MRYFITSGERELSVDVARSPDGKWEVHVEGQAMAIEPVSVGDHVVLLVDGRVLDVQVDGNLPKLSYSARGARGAALVETDRTRGAARAKSEGMVDAERVVAPMPGRIVRVLVKEGDRIESGTPLVVVEAMKMENELRATHGALVRRVVVKAGDAVEGGATLLELAP